MAIGSVNPGYTGYAELSLASNPVRFTDASINVRQEINAPDLIMGHWDHNAYVYGPIEIGGSMSGPVTENFVTDTAALWGWATNRGSGCGALTTQDLTLHYYCDRLGGDGKTRTFPDMLPNSLSFSVAAGDIAQFTIDVMGAGQPSPPTWSAGVDPTITTEEKLVTWDNVAVALTVDQGDISTGTLGTSCFSNFEFTINNNLEAVYAICDGSNYYPFDIVPGLRTITGSLSAYNIPEVEGAVNYSDFTANQQATITFTIAGLDFAFKCRFHRVEATSSVGPIISTIAFTGVGEQASLDSP